MAGDVEECEDEQHHPPEPRTHLSKRQSLEPGGTNVRWSAYKDENKDYEQWEGRMRSPKLIENTYQQVLSGDMGPTS
jgi:hypothetical protein